MKTSPPKYIVTILRRLTSNGFEAYLAGGSVRDLLLGRRPGDWDICTAATPQQVMVLFPRSHPTGLAHGTVTVVVHGSCSQVTTFRNDGQYLDHRHPETVEFITDLTGDLARRDFTMNAMARSLEGKLFDPFKGQEDIKSRLIRCVGTPDERFQEDALRMLRALRFSAQLGFQLEGKTLASISKNAALCKNLASERVATELEKMLLSPAPELISKMLTLNLLCDLTENCAQPVDLSPLKRLPRTALLRWSGLAALLMNQGVIHSPRAFFSRLKLSSVIINFAGRGSELAQTSRPETALDYKRLLAANGEQATLCQAAALDALAGGTHLKTCKALINSSQCYSLKDLEIKGEQLMNLGYEGQQIGQALDRLLQHVLEFPLDNQPKILLELSKKNVKLT